MSERGFVYVARCGDGSLYTGIARDVRARIEAHASGKGARYTRGRGPITLLASTRCRDKGEALRVEIAIKALSRPKKIALLDRGLGRWAARRRRR
jgi:putative endonuclease